MALVVFATFGIIFEEYKKQISYDDIKGFEGSDQAISLQIIADYIDGVACR